MFVSPHKALSKVFRVLCQAMLSPARPQCVCVICKCRQPQRVLHTFGQLQATLFAISPFHHFDTRLPRHTKPLALKARHTQLRHSFFIIPTPDISARWPRSGAIYQISYTNFCCLSTLILALSRAPPLASVWEWQQIKHTCCRSPHVNNNVRHRHRVLSVLSHNKTPP